MPEGLGGDNGKTLSPYEQIRRGIIDGDFEPGSALVETSVAKWCGVSRTPVREAFRRLEQDGLLNRTDRGMVVRERSPEEVLDTYEVRIALESLAARLAAERATTMDKVRLRALCSAAEEADPGDGDDLAQRNRDFHAGVVRASHNEPLIDVLERLNVHILRYSATTLTYPGRWDEALKEHREMLEAVENGDGGRAAQIASHHFVSARDIRLQLWAAELR